MKNSKSKAHRVSSWTCPQFYQQWCIPVLLACLFLSKDANKYHQFIIFFQIGWFRFSGQKYISFNFQSLGHCLQILHTAVDLPGNPDICLNGLYFLWSLVTPTGIQRIWIAKQYLIWLEGVWFNSSHWLKSAPVG